jgi:two-component system phosphate regulon sensor histidine kinase PhoR
LTLLALLGLLAVAVAAWLAGSYIGHRRATRALLRQIQAERQLHSLNQQIGALGEQLAAEQAILERLPDPVILFGADRGILRLNAAARTALGVGVPALLRHPGFRDALERALERGQDQFVELSLPVPIARELYVSVLAMEGASRRLLVVLSDRTRERAVERMRADFVANASHELRTPLTSLIGFIDTLRGPAADDPAAQARFLGIMAEQAQRMNRLIDDLLSLSRVELTEHVPPSGRVAVETLIEQVAAGFAPLLARRRVNLDTDIAPDLPDLPGDEDQLGQVLQNLVENAIKYGREGGRIELSAGAAPRAGRAGVQIAVQDDGPGIPPIHIPRLTERFYRVNTHRSRAAGGTGLGLAIVKHIVNRHRGHLRIDSTEGAGTTVTVWLPASVETLTQSSPEGRGPSSPPPSGLEPRSGSRAG